MPDSPKVVKLAQPGYDVKTAGDENLIYNSNWPLLKIYKQGSFTTSQLSDPYTFETVVKHDLGYFPFFWCFANLPLETWNAPSSVTPVQRSEFMIPIQAGGVVITKDRLLFGPDNITHGSIQFYYYIFALDLEKNYIAPQIKVGGIQGESGSNTFKLAKEGKSIDSNRLEDYIIHSKARSPLVHMIKNDICGSDETTYNYVASHNLGYIPMFFGFSKNTVAGNETVDNYSPLFTASSGPGFIADNNTVKWRGSINNLFPLLSTVILKDPFNIEDRIDIST